MDIVTLLKAGRERVEQGWSQGAWARDQHGDPCDFQGTDAACFCAVGALHRNDGAVQELWDTLNYQITFRPLRQSVVGWNDDPHRTQADVLDLFDRAISRLGVSGPGVSEACD